jgi:hypothetical protein
LPPQPAATTTRAVVIAARRRVVLFSVVLLWSRSAGSLERAGEGPVKARVGALVRLAATVEK